MKRARYRTVRRPGTGESVLEHRLVMEQAIGRRLRTNEHVHHINGDTHDNRLENLQVLTPKEHMKLHKQKHPYTKPCVVCGEVFRPHPTKRKRAKTCSSDCFRELIGREKRGGRHPSATLTATQVREARARAHQGEQIVAIAAEYNVNRRTLASAVAGRTWKHITEPPPLVRPPGGDRRPAAALARANAPGMHERVVA